ncbi:MAG: heme A synthase [Chloroflexi bacterium]|nr:heme A synthase [Chloroflexota bacterium]
MVDSLNSAMGRRHVADDAQDKTLSRWLYAVCFFIIVLVVFGGWVRLTRSGLSIVEWDIITGMVPPLSEAAWQAEFLQYQETPEFIIINKSMTLSEYKFIYYNEWIHRMLGRFTGMLFALPCFYFLFRGRIPWRKSGIYVAIGLGFAFQGFLGWYMVSSGLVDIPAVSHYRLTAHLVTALGLLGLTYWAANNNIYGAEKPADQKERSAPKRMAVFLIVALLIQISYGGLVAGLKAGHVSNTWPLMYGRIIPAGLLSAVEPWWRNLLESPPAVHYVHRWFAFTVLIVAIWLLDIAKKRDMETAVTKGAKVMIWLVVLQISLGVSVVWFGVPLWLALTHQATAIALFLATVYLNHRLYYV